MPAHAHGQAARQKERAELKMAMERLASVQAALTASQEQLVADQARLASLMREVSVWVHRRGDMDTGLGMQVLAWVGVLGKGRMRWPSVRQLWGICLAASLWVRPDHIVVTMC